MNSAKFSRFKFNTQKLLALLRTNNKQPEKETIKTIQFTKALKRIKCLRINQGGERLLQ